MKKSPPAWWFGYLRTVRDYDLLTVQSLMESFDTQQALFSRFSTFEPVTLVIDTEFGEMDEQLESMEANLGIDQGWDVDREVSNGRGFTVNGYQVAMEKSLRDRIKDINDANRSGPSRRSDFSQSARILQITQLLWLEWPSHTRNGLYKICCCITSIRLFRMT
jgi:hypothetical protein